MKCIVLLLSINLLLSACQNNTLLPENQKDDYNTKDANTQEFNKKISIHDSHEFMINKNHQQRQRPTPPTANKLLNELKLGNVWQSLDLTYDNLSDDWRLLVVSDNAFNNLDLPIVKKDLFTVTFEKSLVSKNYRISMPHNCNGSQGFFVLKNNKIQIDSLVSTEKRCAELPKELDDTLIHNAILKGHYEIFQKDKQRILKIHHNHQNWFFYSDDPMSTRGLLKSFRKDRDDFNSVDFDRHNLLGDWRLYAISDKDHMPRDLPVWQKNADERYLLNFKSDTTNQLWLSMPNYCNQIKIPFTTKENGIVADFNQTISTNAKCDIPEYYKDADESIIHNAVYNGNYKILQNDNGLLLKINHNDRILFFISHSYNEKEKAYWEQNGRK